MANNRLFLYNKKSKRAYLLAKSFGGDGWEMRNTKKSLQEFLKQDDWESVCEGGKSNFCLLTELELPDDAEDVEVKLAQSNTCFKKTKER